MNTNYSMNKIRDFCEITSSKRIFASEYISEGIPFYRGKEIIEKQQGKLNVSTEIYISEAKFLEIKDKFGIPQKGDLLLTSVGTLGIPYVVKDNETFYFKDGNLTWFRNFQGLNSKYLYYWLLSPLGKAELQKATIGSSQSAYTIHLLNNLLITLPKLSIQEEIVNILASYDDLIENNHKRIALLEESARLLYQEWFVKFRFPNVKIGRDGLPDGCYLTVLGNVIDAIGGATPSTKQAEYWGGEITWLTPSDITNNDCLYLYNSERKITEAGYNSCSTTLLPAGTIFMTSRASIGYFAILDHSACTNQGFIAVVPKILNSRNFFLYHLIHRVDELHSKATGTTFKELSKKVFRELPIIMPSQEMLEQFEQKTQPIIEQICILKKQNVFLVKARDELLPKLMSGKIKI